MTYRNIISKKKHSARHRLMQQAQSNDQKAVSTWPPPDPSSSTTSTTSKANNQPPDALQKMQNWWGEQFRGNGDMTDAALLQLAVAGLTVAMLADMVVNISRLMK
eukprot:CAMPEP_0113935542 /NCGR_PEP_ID=MMETSP1339-20121228/2690_1 /TAXON_ID=94617 /ORGANISM="Fibrocapsa japonica" /LENGTH=104 /DNA_ID=CAMNT_0000937743 /DNA_START=157 /DNA_END=471 /DNA_ORIENTATION=+ /assembly_acc=CAM_ASM_000762